MSVSFDDGRGWMECPPGRASRLLSTRPGERFTPFHDFVARFFARDLPPEAPGGESEPRRRGERQKDECRGAAEGDKTATPGTRRSGSDSALSAPPLLHLLLPLTPRFDSVVSLCASASPRSTCVPANWASPQCGALWKSLPARHFRKPDLESGHTSITCELFCVLCVIYA